MRKEKLERYGFNYKELVQMQNELDVEIDLYYDSVDLYKEDADGREMNYDDILEIIIKYVAEKYGIVMDSADIVPAAESDDSIWFWLVKTLEVEE